MINNYKLIELRFNSDKVQAFIQEYQTQARASDIDRGMEGQDIGKAELVRELTILFRREKDPKLKADIGMKLFAWLSDDRDLHLINRKTRIN